jgi:hypothetical protein
MHCARLCVLYLVECGLMSLPAGTSLSCWMIRALSAYALQWHRDVQVRFKLRKCRGVRIRRSLDDPSRWQASRRKGRLRTPGCRSRRIGVRGSLRQSDLGRVGPARAGPRAAWMPDRKRQGTTLQLSSSSGAWSASRSRAPESRRPAAVVLPESELTWEFSWPVSGRPGPATQRSETGPCTGGRGGRRSAQVAALGQRIDRTQAACCACDACSSARNYTQEHIKRNAPSEPAQARVRTAERMLTLSTSK